MLERVVAVIECDNKKLRA